MKTKSLITIFVFISSFSAWGWEQDDSKREQFRQTMHSCMEENGLQALERGQRPSREDMAVIDACLESKGIAKPEFRPGGGNKPKHGRAHQR